MPRRRINFFGRTSFIHESAWAAYPLGPCTCLRVCFVDPCSASRRLHRARLSHASIAADSVAEGFRFFRHQPTDLLLVGSPIFLAYRIEQLLPNHLVDTPGSN